LGWWKLAAEYRGLYKPWALKLPADFQAKGYARVLTRRAFDVAVSALNAANDRDFLRW
jgi:hypothetical protein